MKKILIISDKDLSFPKNDYDILSKHFETEIFVYKKQSDRWKLLKALRKYDINISWWILGYSYLAVKASKVYGKKSVLIAAGWDVATIPEIGYGYALTPKRKKRLLYCLENASRIISVSNNLKKQILEISPGLDVITIPLGFEADKYVPKGKKKNVILTVSASINKLSIKLKGLDTFIQSAESLPDIKFIIAGRGVDNDAGYLNLKNTAPPNVRFADWLDETALLKQYQEAKVYAQLSAQESFGSSLAEAMLCECVPVVSDRGALPEVIGKTGIIVPFADLKKTVAAFGIALKSGTGKSAREHIKSSYPLILREKRLVEVINNIITKR